MGHDDQWAVPLWAVARLDPGRRRRRFVEGDRLGIHGQADNGSALAAAGELLSFRGTYRPCQTPF